MSHHHKAVENGKVLVVDDEPHNLQLIGENLRRAGIRFIFAINGDEALSVAEKEAPDLILLDVMMPGKNGFEVCQELKANPQTAAIPIIFLTAANEVGDVVSGFAAGAIDYIKKPFIREELLARVQTHLQLTNFNNELLARSQQKNEMLARLAHDVKNPAGAITGLVEFIRSDLSEGSYASLDEVNSILNIIQEASQGMMDLVNGILSEANEEAAADSVQIQIETDVASVARHLVELNQAHARERNQQIELDTQIRPQAVISRRILSEMLDNLLSNAVKYSRENSTIHVRLGPAKEVPNGLRFEVEDAANTITPDRAETIFKRFARGDQAPSGKQSSHGVGLAIVKRLVTLNQGKIGLYPRESGDGNIFYLELPASKGSE